MITSILAVAETGLEMVLVHLLVAVIVIAVIWVVCMKLMPADWLYVVKIILGAILLIYLIKLLIPFMT